MSRSQQVFAQYNLDWNNFHRHVFRGAHCLNTSLRAQLHAATLYWQVTFHALNTHLLIFLSQHPSLPVPLFPRYSQSSLRTSAAPSLSLSPDMQVDTFSTSPPSSSYIYLNLTEGPPVRLDVITAIGLPAGESTPVSLFLSSGTQFHSSVQGCRY